MTPFNVLIFNINSGKPEFYDVMPYFVNRYKDIAKKDRPTTFKDCKQFIEEKAMCMFWSRCEWEILVSDWPTNRKQYKIDVYKQINANLDVITKVFMENLKLSTDK